MGVAPFGSSFCLLFKHFSLRADDGGRLDMGGRRFSYVLALLVGSDMAHRLCSNLMFQLPDPSILSTPINLPALVFDQLPGFSAINETTHSAPPVIDLPSHVTTLFLNVGSNLDPPVPPKSYGSSAWTLAVEPVVGCQIPAHPLIKVIPAAIDPNRNGLALMQLYNKNHVSSSLSMAPDDAKWNRRREAAHEIKLVPVMSLLTLIQSLPPHLEIPYIKTDMQGSDFGAVSAAATFLAERRVDYLYTEVYLNDVTTYVGVYNDFCRDWLPLLPKLGYDLVYMKYTVRIKVRGGSYRTNVFRHNPIEAQEFCDAQIKKNGRDRPTITGLAEGDVMWKRRGAIERKFGFREIPRPDVVEEGVSKQE